MYGLARRHWPLFGIVGVYWVTVMALVLISTNLNQGRLIYPLDDTYIHMSIAKNAVLHHVWGVTRYEFTSSTSSPLWTFLLALTYLSFGVNEKAPLILNVIFGTLATAASYLFLTKYIANRLRTFLVSLVVVFVTPLPTLTVIGMEHVLHALLSLCFVYFSIRVLSTTAKPARRNFIFLVLLSALVTAIRYEGLFLALVVCVLFLSKKRILFAVTIGISALLPVTLYGAWSVAHGWYFLPNSVLLGAAIPSLDLKGTIHLVTVALNSIGAQADLLILLISSLSFLLIHYFKNEKSCAEIKNANLMFVLTLLLHVQFTPPVYLFRHEAYLALLGILVVGIAASNVLPTGVVLRTRKKVFQYYAIAMIMGIVIAAPFVYRMLKSLRDTPRATNNIYEQQYQMGTFLKKYYQGKTIAANDIGAITYLADIHLIDLWGIGSLEPAKLMLQKHFTARQVNDLTSKRGAAIAMVYADWFDDELPQQWLRAGQWIIPNNVVCADDKVSVYAVDSSERSALIQNLRQFAINLPRDVTQHGAPMEKVP
jgi:hypothetical protein